MDNFKTENDHEEAAELAPESAYEEAREIVGILQRTNKKNHRIPDAKRILAASQDEASLAKELIGRINLIHGSTNHEFGKLILKIVGKAGYSAQAAAEEMLKEMYDDLPEELQSLSLHHFGGLYQTVESLQVRPFDPESVLEPAVETVEEAVEKVVDPVEGLIGELRDKRNGRPIRL